MKNISPVSLLGLADEELILHVKAGNENAFVVLFSRYICTIRALSVNQPAGVEQEDLIQEGLMGLFSAANSYLIDAAASFKTYAVRCIKNRILSARKTALRLKNIPLSLYTSLDSDEIGEFALVDEESNPEQYLLRREAFETLELNMLSRLSKMEFGVLKLYLSGYSYEAIAAKLDSNPKMVDNALQRVRRKLRTAN